MKCSMCEKNARVLHKILQNLAKIGSDLYLEAMVSGLSLGTVSCLESSFAKIELAQNFFIEYHQQIRPPIPDGSSETKCRISLKSLLSVFRHLKQVEVCTLRLDQDSDRLVIKLKCAEEKVRMMYVPILEQDELDRDSSKDKYPNKLMCVTSVLSNVMTNFQSEMEVTMDISKEKIIVKNYIDDRIVEKTLLRTRVTMQAEEFQEYTVNQETRLTFCHRSFRAFLSLSEAFGTNCSIKIDFDTEGAPIMFSVSEAPIEGKLLMMTLDREMYANQLAMTYDGSMHSDVHPHDSSVIKSQNKRQKPSPLVGDKDKETSPLNPKRHRTENSPPKSLTDSVIAAMDTLIDSQQDDTQATNCSTGNDTFLRSIPVVVQIHSNPPA
uniref:Uncharacterized protein n=1 Tax=Phlebotomus papatasi TaxID=29031 RepID=A0A1B0DQ52_PHLPP